MNQSDTSIIPHQRSLNTIYGEGYVYRGPLPSKQYELTSKCIPKVLNDNQYQFKVILLGDSVGIDYRSKIVTLGDKQINLQIFDIAGQERFRSATHSYYRDADALLLLYDVTSYSSFDNISSWLNQIKEFTDDRVIIILIGNKIDKSPRMVSREDGERLARNYQIGFLERSARTSQNIELAFMITAQDLLDKK